LDPSTSKPILVLGASGFLGKAVCAKLDEMGREYVPGSLSTGVDLREPAQVSRLFDEVKPGSVLNCAAYVGGIQFGYEHPAELFHNNLLMSINLLHACWEFSVQRLVNPVSNCAYPAKLSVFREEQFWDGPLHESVLVYGMARKMSWVGAWAYARQYSTDTITLILSNMYGPRDHFDPVRSHALGALIKKMVDAQLNGEKEVIVWGTGNPVREWLYVDDGAEAMIRALDIDPYEGPINVGVEKGISIRDLAFLIKQATEYSGTMVFDSTRPDGAAHKTVAGNLGKELLGWQPEVSLSDGIGRTVEYYMAEERPDDTQD